jgi:hypothetical protein
MKEQFNPNKIHGLNNVKENQSKQLVSGPRTDS